MSFGLDSVTWLKLFVDYRFKVHHQNRNHHENCMWEADMTPPFKYFTVAAQSHGLDITAGVFPISDDTDVTSNSADAQPRKNRSKSSYSGSSRIGEDAHQRRNSHSACLSTLTDTSSTDGNLSAATSTGAELNLILFDEVSTLYDSWKGLFFLRTRSFCPHYLL